MATRQTAEQAEIAARHALIRTVECKTERGGCGAQPHQQCLTPAGRTTNRPHQARRDEAIAQGLYQP